MFYFTLYKTNSLNACISVLICVIQFYTDFQIFTNIDFIYQNMSNICFIHGEWIFNIITTTTEVKIKRIIFQIDSLFSLLFAVAQL